MGAGGTIRDPGAGSRMVKPTDIHTSSAGNSCISWTSCLYVSMFGRLSIHCVCRSHVPVSF